MGTKSSKRDNPDRNHYASNTRIDISPQHTLNPECLFPGWSNKVSSNFEFLEEVGRGGFGQVWRVRRKRDDAFLACKVMNKLKMSPNTMQSTIDEVAYLTKLQHPNIVKLICGYETKRKIYLFQELMEGGSLDSQIGNCTEIEVMEITKQILNGLAFAHSHGVIHSDLKPENVLYGVDGKVRLIDFGLSKARRRWQWVSKVGGTPAYIAPECLTRRYTEAVDMWALGIIIFELFFGYVPFTKYKKDPIKTINDTLRGFENVVKPGRGNWFPAEKPISEDARNLICNLIKVNPAQRLTAKEALKHHFLRPRVDAELSNEDTDTFLLESLIYKRNLNKIQLFLRQVIMRNSSPETYYIQDLDRVFKKYDTNGDGYLDWEKFNLALTAFEQTEENISISELEQLFKSIDTTNSGKVHYDDLISWLSFQHLSMQDDRVWEAVMGMDLNGNQKISLGDLNHLLEDEAIKEKISIATIEEMKKMVEGGSLEYIDFIQMMEQGKHGRDNQPSRSPN